MDFNHSGWNAFSKTLILFIMQAPNNLNYSRCLITFMPFYKYAGITSYPNKASTLSPTTVAYTMSFDPILCIVRFNFGDNHLRCDI